jgi:tryptophan synthase beta chain
MAPVVKMHTLGHNFVPLPIHAGGLRYHGMTPSIYSLYGAGYLQAVAVPQLATFQAAIQFTQTEGIVPAPEAAHAIRVAIDEALDAKKKGDSRVVLFILSAHGDYDMSAYQAYLSCKLEDYEYLEEAIRISLENLRK